MIHVTEPFQIGYFGIHHDHAIPGQFDNHVRLGFP